MEAYKIDLLEKELKEELIIERLEAYKAVMIARLQDAFIKNEDICDVINELDLEFDDYINLEFGYINECIIEAAKGLK
jgi:hypothetical protein